MSEDQKETAKTSFLLAVIAALMSVFTAAAIGIFIGQKELVKEVAELKGGLAVSVPHMEQNISELKEDVKRLEDQVFNRK